MKIDQVSTQLIQFALYVDSIKPGVISEIWLDTELLDSLRNGVPAETSIPNFLEKLSQEVWSLADERRKSYLKQIVKSLEYQLKHSKDTKIHLEEFTRNCFGIIIPVVDDETITLQFEKITAFETKIGKSLFEVLEICKIETTEIQNQFLKNLSDAKQIVSQKLLLELSEHEQFNFKTVTGESWSAFNKHTAPFKSDLILNLDYPVNTRDVRNLAFHEGYGGHHTELTLKDRLLVEEGRGEHGLVITYSPQTFISEAIAVNSQDNFDDQIKSDSDKLISLYDELTGGILLNKISYLYHQDGAPKTELVSYLSQLPLTAESRDFIVNFATDKIYGVYTLVYHFAGVFLATKLKQTKNPKNLLKEIYTLPTTPDML